MRIWHKDLISVLPRQQLLGQWRECCAIAKNIAENGTPNHILVNRIMNYPLSHFYTYGKIIASEMKFRGYNVDFSRFEKYFSAKDVELIKHDVLFRNWHNDRYFLQCFYNLDEKFDCGGIPYDEWKKVVGAFWSKDYKQMLQ